jgi:hypothetical protein
MSLTGPFGKIVRFVQKNFVLIALLLIALIVGVWFHTSVYEGVDDEDSQPDQIQNDVTLTDTEENQANSNFTITGPVDIPQDNSVPIYGGGENNYTWTDLIQGKARISKDTYTILCGNGYNYNTNKDQVKCYRFDRKINISNDDEVNKFLIDNSMNKLSVPNMNYYEDTTNSNKTYSFNDNEFLPQLV